MKKSTIGYIFTTIILLLLSGCSSKSPELIAKEAEARKQQQAKQAEEERQLMLKLDKIGFYKEVPDSAFEIVQKYTSESKNALATSIEEMEYKVAIDLKKSALKEGADAVLVRDGLKTIAVTGQWFKFKTTAAVELIKFK